jgi:transcriptional regulator with XRE-family HTH domain
MRLDLISKALKKMRLEKGLSLAGLGARANTSAATLYKYENGWERFELYTLNKLATALGCSLEINFTPNKPQRSPNSLNGCLKRIQRLFWDQRLKASDLKKYPQWVVERVIEYGSLEDVQSVINVMGKRMFLKQVSRCRFQSAKTFKFWAEILEKEGVKCMKRSFQRGVKNF